MLIKQPFFALGLYVQINLSLTSSLARSPQLLSFFEVKISNAPAKRRSQVRIPLKPWFFFRLLLSNCLNWKIYCDDHSSLSYCLLLLYAHFHAWTSEPSIKITDLFLMILFLIPLRSLRVYVLKQLFFLVSLNSGVINFYLATIHLDFKEYLIRLLKKPRELSMYIPVN